MSQCPRCGGDINKYPALSRRNNENICSSCGEEEAMIDFAISQNLLPEHIETEIKNLIRIINESSK